MNKNEIIFLCYVCVTVYRLDICDIAQSVKYYSLISLSFLDGLYHKASHISEIVTSEKLQKTSPQQRGSAQRLHVSVSFTFQTQRLRPSLMLSVTAPFCSTHVQKGLLPSP